METFAIVFVCYRGADFSTLAPKMIQMFITTSAMPAIVFPHFMIVMLEYPRIHGDTMSHTPITNCVQLKIIASFYFANA